MAPSQVTVLSSVPEIAGEAPSNVVRRSKENGKGKVVDSHVVFNYYNKFVKLFSVLNGTCP